ncbi:MAG: sensor histidine kinase [Sulfurovum sp.]|nr:sensor histidine kinase [Sulfurovum sp.]
MPTSNYEFTLLPLQEKTFFIKIISASSMNIGITIQNISDYYKSSFRQIKWFAFYFGAISIMLMYNFIIYLMTKNKSFLYYVLFHLSHMIFALALSGIAFQLFWPDTPALNKYVIPIFMSIAASFGLLFTIYFLNLKVLIPKLYLFLYTWVWLNFVLALTPFIFGYGISIKMVSISNLFEVIMLFIIVSYLAFFKKNINAFFYFIAWSFFLVGVATSHFSNIGLVPSSILTTFGFQIGSFFEALLLSIALAYYYSQLSEKHNKSKIMLMEQSRFASMGQAIGHITHQWKHPLTLLGASVTLLETIFRHDKENTLQHLEKELPCMTHSIKHMKKTMIELSHYYSGKMESIAFSPKETINNSISLLSAKSTLKNAKITMDIPKNLEIINYEHIFSNIIIVLIDNSLDAFKSQNDNQIQLSLISDKKKHILRYRDNAGGIKIKPIEKVFDYFVSSKGDAQGHGIGLAMVKMLVEERLDGKIRVENSDDGVVFEICFAGLGNGGAL